MSRGVRVFRTESRTERVNLGQCRGERFRLKLPAHRQIGCSGKEISCVIDLAISFPRRIVWVDGGDPKQFACTFAIASGDDGRI